MSSNAIQRFVKCHLIPCILLDYIYPTARISVFMEETPFNFDEIVIIL